MDGTAAVDLSGVLEQGQDTAAVRGVTMARGNGSTGRRLWSTGRHGAWAGAVELAARWLVVEACGGAGVT